MTLSRNCFFFNCLFCCVSFRMYVIIVESPLKKNFKLNITITHGRVGEKR